MPIYEYECEKCACRFEKKRRFNEDGSSPRCPRCKGKTRRLISPSAIVFKGPGFYVTDIRGKPPSEEGKADKAESGKKVESSKKTESKPSGKDSAKKGGS